MSEAKHTPGPWHADTRDHYTLGGDMVEITLHDPTSKYVTDQIASVMLDTGYDSPADRKNYRRQEADAHLIAAAPELLEALQEFLDYSEGGCNPNLEDVYRAKARAAIAKATGGAQ